MCYGILFVNLVYAAVDDTAIDSQHMCLSCVRACVWVCNLKSKSKFNSRVENMRISIPSLSIVITILLQRTCYCTLEIVHKACDSFY